MKGIEPGISPSNSLQKGKRKCEKEKERKWLPVRAVLPLARISKFEILM
jgi:hypothetical protein